MKELVKLIGGYGAIKDNNVALTMGTESISYKKLYAFIRKWAKLFKKKNISEGTKVLVKIEQKLVFIEIWLAIWEIGAVPIPVDSNINERELMCIIDSASPEWIITDEEKKGKIRKCLDRIRLTEDVWGMRIGDKEELLNTAFIVYTSGTTGKPKCVKYDNDATYATLESLIEAYNLTSKDIALTPLTPSLPATLFTIVLPILSSGGTLILEDKPIPGKILKDIYNEKVTIFFAVPYMYKLLLEAGKIRDYKKGDCLRRCLSTSAYLSPETFYEFYLLTGQYIRSIFCTSEVMYITYHYEDDMSKMMKSVGKPQKGINIKIVDEKGKELGTQEKGEILVSGTHTSSGYLGKDELWNEIYVKGWVHTGDLGYLDSEGYLYITGRIHNTINVGGYLVSPEEVEEILVSSKSVKEALVVGEEDELTGERVVAYLVINNNYNSDMLLKYCKERLLDYKVPTEIVIVNELPKGRYGKVRRRLKKFGTNKIV